MDLSKKHNIHFTGNPQAGKTLVFGHGFGVDQQSFSQIVPAFEHDYRIILYDNAGGGQSDLSSYSYERYETLEGYVTDLTAIMALAQGTPATFIGHSVSGMIGMMAANRQPHLFDKLVLIGSSPRYLDDAPASYTGGFDEAALQALFDAMQTNYEAWVIGFSPLAMRNEDRPELAEQFARSLQALRPDIALAVARAIFFLDHRMELPRVTRPTLIIQTANDIVVPAVVSEYMEQHIPGSKRIKINAQGHFPQISAPGEIITALRSFV
ncbi:alpha/beta hydrolase [Chitinophaga oryzae]|uniref:Alpha/beta hydrolase n=1 Tax=Chitinophaga oryzae TaxID=2725414 RepID=A0AAE7D5H7_9BACT|nr:alpha/beta hydrolase [Chitinophaga oryzae]QJB30210.1 alpha/beta hydrolase [Chitinophaga oryzae]QJB36716.1 alpha/beta hydrolase [Chitinophaga oryzae]